MFLCKGGVTVEVTHPTDIARYKAAGYVEVKPEAPEGKTDPASKPRPARTKEEKAVKDGS